MADSFDRGGVGSSPLAVGLLRVADSVAAVVAPGAGRVDFSVAKPSELVALLHLVGTVLNQLMLVLLCLLHECERRGVAQGISGVRKTEDWLAQALRMDLPRARTLVRQARALHAASAARSLSDPDPGPCPRAAGMAAGFVSFEQAHRIGIVLKELATFDGASPEALEFAEDTMVELCHQRSPQGLEVLGRQLREDLGPEPAERPTADPSRLRDLCALSFRRHARTDGALTELHGLLTPDMEARLKSVLEPLAAPIGTAELPDPRTAKQRLLDALLESVTVAGRILPQQKTSNANENDDDNLAEDADSDVEPVDISADGADPRTGQPAGQQALDLGVELGLGLDGEPPVPAVPEGFRGKVAAPSRDGLLVAVTLAELRASEKGEPTPGAHRAAQILSTTSAGSRISVEQARLLACEAGIIPVVLDGESRPIDVGRAKRLATPDQRRLLALRDKGCVGPGCDRPPDWSQAHHITWWTLGGETNLDELRLLCLWHHHLVHDQHWDIRATADGGTEWRAPAWVDPTRTWVRTR
ncbi:MAG: DUF222 domain-containing protein [Motilibacteraceae bacterium]